MLIKKEIVEKVGLFDERFGRGNFEDDDYCRRAELAGYRNMIAGDCYVHHVGSASWTGPELSEQLIRNQKIYNEKWGLP
jgi:GT2 family glycosyltransferase